MGQPNRIQRTQLLNLQPAGGAMPVGQTATDIKDIEALEEQLVNGSQNEIKNKENLLDFKELGNLGANSIAKALDNMPVKFKKKKGHTHKHLTVEEEKKYMQYRMITDLFDFDELKTRKDFLIKRYKESLYRGEIQDGMRYGQGICVYSITRVYEGDWAEDKRHGKGYERFSNGNQYLGDYDMGKVSGKGLYTWTNGDTYDGEWVNGIKHGYGVWKGATGDSYIG